MSERRTRTWEEEALALKRVPRETGRAARATGKRIEAVRVRNSATERGTRRDMLELVFVDGTTLAFADNGQDCCESRYMTCDDDLASFTGDTFVGWEVADAPSIPVEHGDKHDVQFLRIKLGSGSVITCETHNEHNGYYGGFSVQVVQ